MSRLGERRVLAIDPTTRGFGFAVLEGPERLIDWGVGHVRIDKKSRTLVRIRALLNRYVPQVLVLEEPEGSRRCLRVRELLVEIAALGSQHDVPVKMFSRRAIRRAFAPYGAVTKEQIAAVIALRFPELASRLPRPRKPWMTEAEGMSVFDAAALSVVLLNFHKRYRTPPRSVCLVK